MTPERPSRMLVTMLARSPPYSQMPIGYIRCAQRRHCRDPRRRDTQHTVFRKCAFRLPPNRPEPSRRQGSPHRQRLHSRLWSERSSPRRHHAVASIEDARHDRIAAAAVLPVGVREIGSTQRRVSHARACRGRPRSCRDRGDMTHLDRVRVLRQLFDGERTPGCDQRPSSFASLAAASRCSFALNSIRAHLECAEARISDQVANSHEQRHRGNQRSTTKADLRTPSLIPSQS